MSLSLDPQHITDEFWYYETKSGIETFHEIRIKGEYIRTDSVTIPWRKIIASVKRRKSCLKKNYH